MQILIETCDIVNDDVQHSLKYFQVLSGNFTMETMKFYLKLKDAPIIGHSITKMLIQKVYFVY